MHAMFLFRTENELKYHYRDSLRQQELLRTGLTKIHTQMNNWLSKPERAPTAFYFYSITHWQLASWPRGRIVLASDAYYTARGPRWMATPVFRYSALTC